MEVSRVDSTKNQMDEDAIENFRQYLRIPTVHPNINYDECIKFLEKQAKSADLPYKIYRCAPNKPILVMSWIGKNQNLPSIWLNSHMDVVPVYEDKWKYKPFEAHMDEKGNIYARGAQDMKCNGIQYLEAIKRLKKESVTLKRTVHIAFVPEEEVLGILGMKDFTKTEDFRQLNVGFSLDEGEPTAKDDFILFYGERTDWKIRVHCPGEQGHGSLLLQNPPGNKIGAVINKINEFRNTQLEEYMKNPSNFTLGNFTSINLTILEGGVQLNVIPPEFIATFDVRIPASVDLDKFEKDLNKWCKEVGEDVWIEFKSKADKVDNTKLDESNPFWAAFKKAAKDLNISVIPAICPGASDSRFIRELGIPAFGFSPINNTVLRYHENNEYLNTKIFLKGIEIYVKIITAVANVE